MKLLPLFLVLSLSSPALAGELERELLPATTRSLAHVDLERFHATELFRAARERELGHLVEVDDPSLAELGLDPLRDVLSLTVFDGGDHDQALALVAVRPEAAARILAGAQSPLLGLQRDVFVEEDGLRLRVWTKGDSIELYSFDEARGDAHLFLLGDERALVLAAARVLRGDAPNLAGASEALVSAQPGPGSFFYAEARGPLPGLGAEGPARAAAELVTGLVFDAAEVDGVLGLSLELTTDSAAETADVARVLDGALAFAHLLLRRDGSRSACAELLDALSFESEGARLRAEFSHESHALLAALDELGVLGEPAAQGAAAAEGRK